MAEYLSKECGDLNEVVSDNDDDEDDLDDAKCKEAEVAEIGTGEALTMFAMKDKLEKIRVLNKKQCHINDYLMLE